MNSPIWLCQLKMNHSLEKFTWMLCISEWASAVFKLHTSAKPSTMQDTCMTCSSLWLAFWLPFQLLVQFKNLSYQIMIWDGQWSSRVLTADPKKREMLVIKRSTSPNPDIALWITTSPTISSSKMSIMTLSQLGMTRTIKIFLNNKATLMKDLQSISLDFSLGTQCLHTKENIFKNRLTIKTSFPILKIFNQRIGTL